MSQVLGRPTCIKVALDPVPARASLPNLFAHGAIVLSAPVLLPVRFYSHASRTPHQPPSPPFAPPFAQAFCKLLSELSLMHQAGL
eukprot:5605150-Pleurochrysis_carterae.AAC.2